LAKSRAKELIKILGATAVEMTPINHDQAVAKVSHLPQVIASLLAAQLVNGSEDQLRLAGGGLIDTTRIADSNPKLWREILLNNRDALMPLLLNFQKDLSTLISDLDSQTLPVLQRGNEGRNRLPGKHHKQKRDYVYLPVVIDDKPGQLAKLFDECASVEVGVEDLSIEHSPEQETGLITLALSPEGAKKLELHLKNMNWRVHPPRSEK
jgi:prephenate dehydrogenase